MSKLEEFCKITDCHNVEVAEYYLKLSHGNLHRAITMGVEDRVVCLEQLTVLEWDVQGLSTIPSRNVPPGHCGDYQATSAKCNNAARGCRQVLSVSAKSFEPIVHIIFAPSFTSTALQYSSTQQS